MTSDPKRQAPLAGAARCETHDADIVDHTLICGAPQCCPVCCDEAAEQGAAPERAVEPPCGAGLLPCPFCESGDVGETVGTTAHGMRSLYYIECGNCDAMSRMASTRTKAAAGWNTRPTPPAERGSADYAEMQAVRETARGFTDLVNKQKAEITALRAECDDLRLGLANEQQMRSNSEDGLAIASRATHMLTDERATVTRLTGLLQESGVTHEYLVDLARMINARHPHDAERLRLLAAKWRAAELNRADDDKGGV